MRRRKRVLRFICPACLEVYEVPREELNETEPVCLLCGARLLKSRRKKALSPGGEGD